MSCIGSINRPGSGGGSVEGQVPAGNTNVESFIQTDAATNSGNSGSALVDTSGELTGINSAIASTMNTAYEMRRLQYDVGIGYGDEIAQARQLILEAVRGVEGVLTDPAPDALVMDLGESSVNIRARWWINPPWQADMLDAQDRVLEAIKNNLVAHGIDLPYPTQQILFYDQTEATDGKCRPREGWPAGPGDVPPARAKETLAPEN